MLDENATEHEPLLSVHVVVVPNVPRLDVHETVPVGVLEVPVAESATVAVQLVDPPTIIDEGLHETDVVVDLVVPVTVAEPELVP